MNDRDRKLRTARRLGAGVVALGVTGSLGVAGLIGLSAAHHSVGTPTTSTPTRSTVQQPVPQPVPQSGGDDEAGEGSDDGFAFPSNQGVPAPPSLQQGGGGVPHGTTTGS